MEVLNQSSFNYNPFSFSHTCKSNTPPDNDTSPDELPISCQASAAFSEPTCHVVLSATTSSIELCCNLLGILYNVLWRMTHTQCFPGEWEKEDGDRGGGDKEKVPAPKCGPERFGLSCDTNILISVQSTAIILQVNNIFLRWVTIFYIGVTSCRYLQKGITLYLRSYPCFLGTLFVTSDVDFLCPRTGFQHA